MPRRNRENLLEGPVPRHVLRLAVPLGWGMVATTVFSIADIWFISHLGTLHMAALGFTIPVIMVFMGIIFGINVGTSSALSRVYGEGDYEKFRRMATDAVTLAAVATVAAAVVGFSTTVPLFRLMGASDALMPVIRQYMSVWYFALPFMGMMMVGNACIRATGDTLYPSMIMTLMAVMNIIIDPFFIFGRGGLPRLEMTGAAVTVTISAYVTCAISLALLIFRYNLLAGPVWHRGILQSWRRILHVALPSIVSNQIVPLSAMVIIFLAAGFGKEAVAALGVAMRIEGMAVLVFYATGAGASIFIGQNFGAGNYGRIHEAIAAATRYALIWGLFVAAFLWVAAHPVARVFTDNEAVVAYTARYLHWVPLSYIGIGVMIAVNAALNAVGKPVRATTLAVLKAFVIYVPLAYWAQGLYGFNGILLAMAVTNVATGLVAWRWRRKVVG